MSDAFSLVLDGDLELIGGEDEDGAFWFETLAQGASFGDPAPVEVAIASLLRDGSLVERTSDGNRAVTFQIKIKSTDPAGVAQGRARLDRLLGKRTTLVWRDGDYPATVFDVETSSAVRPSGFDDLEYLRNEETVALRFECLPYARSLEPIVDDADTPPSDGGTLLYNCESTTGWSQWYTFSGGGGDGLGTEIVVDSSVYTEGLGSVRIQPRYGYNYSEIGQPNNRLWLNGDRVSGLSLSTGDGGYFSVAIKTRFSQTVQQIWMTTSAGEVEVTNFIASSQDAAGFVRYVWVVDPGLTITGVRFYVIQSADPHYGVAVSGAPYVWYDDFRLQESATTDKQIIKQLDVQGSARTTGSLLVAAPANEVALGKVLVVTAPTAALSPGYTPDARRWATSGSTTADADAPSGSYFSPNGAYGAGGPIFDVPASLFTPGPYVAVLCASIGTFSATFGTRAVLLVDGVEVGDYSEALLNKEGQIQGEYRFFPLGVMDLPPTPVLAPNSDVRVRFEFYGSGTDTKIDNLYLLPAWSVGGRPVADFSIIDCGTGAVAVGGPSSHLWIDSPSASQPQGGYWRGPDASKQLAVSAWPDATKPGLHVFEPGGLTAFVVSTEAQGPRVELTYYPAWHGSAAI